MHTTVLDGPGLCFSNHQANGETVLRTGKYLGAKTGMNRMCYAKLCYNTKWPWESISQNSLVEAQQYTLQSLEEGNLLRANYMAWQGEKKGVLYRKLIFDYKTKACPNYAGCLWLPGTRN